MRAGSPTQVKRIIYCSIEVCGIWLLNAHMPQTLRVCDRRVCPELRRAEIYAIAQKYMRWHVDRSLPRARPVAFVISHEWLSGCFDPGVGI